MTWPEKIDVVTVSTPDHMHFPVAMAAMRLGKPVMVQKPMANLLWETRALSDSPQVRRAHGDGQPGGHGEWHAGAARVDRGRLDWRGHGGALLDKPPDLAAGQRTGLTPPEPAPAHINWKVWQGTVATERPYSPALHPFAWRGLWDYGCGALGDIGCHSFNSAFWVLDLAGDFTVEAMKVSEFDDVTAPQRATIIYQFPAKGKRGPVKVVWQDGIADVNTDKDFLRPPGLPDGVELNPQFGQVFVGTEGVLLINDSYCNSLPQVFPER